MKMLFVWESVEQVSYSYHDGGGVTIIADNLEAARELVKKMVPSGSGVFTEKPDFTASVVTESDKVFIFPDAGCC